MNGNEIIAENGSVFTVKMQLDKLQLLMYMQKCYLQPTTFTRILSTQYETKGSVIFHLLGQTLKGEWEGDAVRGYEDRYNKIKPSLNNAKELLGEIAHNLRETARIVEETDKNIASQFRK